MSPEAIAGKVPGPTPRGVQPTPIERLEMRIAAPNAPVSTAVATSSPRRVTIMRRGPLLDPALLDSDLLRAVDVGVNHLLQVRAGSEVRRLARALDVLLPLRCR